MAGRGWFQAIASNDVEDLLARPDRERWDCIAMGQMATFDCPMDKAWVTIHRALSDGTLYGTLGEPPLSMAILGDHLIFCTQLGDYVYLKNPSEVTEIALALEEVTRPAFIEKVEAMPETDEDMETMNLSLVPDDMEYVWPYFAEMREFYQRAAAEGLAVLFTWG